MKRHNPFPVLKSYEAIYAHGVEVPPAARTIHVSGQVGVGSDGRLAEGGFQAQCLQAIANIEAVLNSARMTLDNVVKVTVFLTQREDLSLLRDVRANHLAVAPAVTVIIVAGLHDPDWLVEIEAVAAAEP
ncbi:RidA family protein [Sphingomonas sp. RB56-2]|uniref:RidA family protein n=1 Tax=Sphingomonas brevis TaxID=2908206 RepID=A0ABT0SC21_9SPHN|nr:RidA family protein [Sphingomonas brevis]MCL6741898.1 RidA family protein [Sphingomonas brevis]